MGFVFCNDHHLHTIHEERIHDGLSNCHDLLHCTISLFVNTAAPAMEYYVATVSLLLVVILISNTASASNASTNDIHERLDPSSIINSLLTRLDSLEQKTTQLTQRCNELEQRNDKLQGLVFQQTQILTELVEENDQQEERSNLMEKALMDVLSEQLRKSRSEMNTVVSHEMQMKSFPHETLAEFLGNRAAELLAYSPHYRFQETTDESDSSAAKSDATTPVNESIGKALNLLTEENRKMMKKVGM